MRFQSNAKFTNAVADVDPVAAPGTTLDDHFMVYKAPVSERLPYPPSKLFLFLDAPAAEGLTLDLYFLVETKDLLSGSATRVKAEDKWVRFATGVALVGGTLNTVTANLPLVGPVYARRTADTLTEMRRVFSAWG